jgi:hypothetical protein
MDNIEDIVINYLYEVDLVLPNEVFEKKISWCCIQSKKGLNNNQIYLIKQTFNLQEEDEIEFYVKHLWKKIFNNIITLKLASPSSLCSQTVEENSMKCEQSERHVVNALAVGVIFNKKLLKSEPIAEISTPESIIIVEPILEILPAELESIIVPEILKPELESIIVPEILTPKLESIIVPEILTPKLESIIVPEILTPELESIIIPEIDHETLIISEKIVSNLIQSEIIDDNISLTVEEENEQNTELPKKRGRPKKFTS